MKFLLLYFFILNYILLVSSQVIKFDELLFNNGTTQFQAYTVETNGVICSLGIPFSIYAADGDVAITNITTTSGAFIPTSVNSNLSILGTFYINASVGVTGLSINAFYGGLYQTHTIVIKCDYIDSSKVSVTVINSGIYYHSLSHIIKVDGLPNVENVKLNLDIDDYYTQIYIGGNLFFISTIYNNVTALESISDYAVNLLFSSNSIPITTTPSIVYNITTSSMVPNFTNYPNTSSSISDCAFTEVNFESLNNYFTTSINSDLSNHFYDPYLMYSNSNNQYIYLVPFTNDILTQQSYTLHMFTTPLQKGFSFNQNALSYPTPQLITPAISSSIYSLQLNLSNVGVPIPLGIGETIQPLFTLRYPFGYVGGNSSKASIQVPLVINPIKKQPSSIYFNYYFAYQRYSYDPTITYEPLDIYPYLTGYSIELVPNGRMILSLNTSTGGSDLLNAVILFSSSSDIYKLFSISECSTFQTPFISANQILQFNLPRFNLYKFILRTKNFIETQYILDSTYKYNINNTITSLYSVKDLDKLPSDFNYYNSFKSIKFYINDLKVTNIGISNKMYIQFYSGFPTNREIKVTFIYSDYRANEKKDIVYSNYNATSKLFEIEFNVPKNIKTGDVSYIVSLDSLDTLNYYSFALPKEYQLRVVESNNIDLMGPVVSDIQYKSDGNKHGWYITIADNYNGFKSGLIIVRNSIDMAERNITIDATNKIGGDSFIGVYWPTIDIDISKCITQWYSIVYAYFEDTEGYSTEYDILKINKKNPFYKFLGQVNSLNFLIDCQPFSDKIYDSPSLVSFRYVNNTDNCGTIFMEYKAYHPNGILDSYTPTVYLSSGNYKFIASSKTIVLSSDSTYTTFSSLLNVPFTFNFENSFYFSVYGIVSKVGTIKGYSPDDLAASGFTTSLVCSRMDNLPLITSSSRLYSSGTGGLNIYGYYFNLATMFEIQYTDDANSNYITIPSDQIIQYSSTRLEIKTIKSTSNPINIRFGNSYGYSKVYTVYPIAFNLPTIDIVSNTSSLCKGSPLCGGSLNGICYNSGCKCISPWSGDDCMSKVIQVTPPKANETSPSTNITIDNENNNQIKFSSIISIVGIREINIEGSSVNTWLFDEWDYKVVSNDSEIQQYYYNSTIKKDDIKVSKIGVTLAWYKTNKTLTFAGETITMNPSSMKYTIQISSYPFNSQLNTLQLIMKASVQSQSECTSITTTNKQFNNSTIDNSDYLKIQLDGYSFFGRFIKRCLIDNYIITSLSNVLLDSSMNEINDNDSSDNNQAYIGINIGQFTTNAIIDPDFSILIDSNSAISNCKGDSGLTTSQLAGIIVGSVGFFIVLIIIICIIIYKSTSCMSIKIRLYKTFRKPKI